MALPSHDNNILVDKALLVIMSGIPIGKTLKVEDFIQKAIIFMDVHDLWMNNDKNDEKMANRIVRLSPSLKHLLNINVDHTVSMTFRDFLEIATR